MEVEIRMVTHRQLLVERGINADAIQPEYCYISEGSCVSHDSEDKTSTTIMTTINAGEKFKIQVLLPCIIVIFMHLSTFGLLNTAKTL